MKPLALPLPAWHTCIPDVRDRRVSIDDYSAARRAFCGELARLADRQVIALGNSHEAARDFLHDQARAGWIDWTQTAAAGEVADAIRDEKAYRFERAVQRRKDAAEAAKYRRKARAKA